MTGKSFIAYLHTAPEKRAEMNALQTNLKGLVCEQEPDALVYELLQSDEDPDRFVVVGTSTRCKDCFLYQIKVRPLFDA